MDGAISREIWAAAEAGVRCEPMPTPGHEVLVQIVRNAPALIARLACPEEQGSITSVSVTAAEFVELNLAEYRADAVLLLGDDVARPTRAMIAEVQSHIDPRKQWTWPHYLTGVRARYRCRTRLVIIALDRAVADWCGQPIDLGDGTVTPRVLGPESIPVITDLDEARAMPELAVLSVAAHADAPGAEHIALAALAASHDLDNDCAVVYADFILAVLGEAARKKLEELMQSGRYEFQSDIARKWVAEGEARGEARGEAKVLLQLLQLKGFTVPEEIRGRILNTTDCEQIETWVGRVLTARSLDEIFEG